MLRVSLRNRLALVFFAITLLAIGALYLYVAPGLQSRLMGAKLHELAVTARTHSGPIRRTVGSATALPRVRELVVRTGGASGDRVTLFSVNRVQGSLQLSPQADSSNPAASGALRFAAAYRAIASLRLSTATESSGEAMTAEAAVPIVFAGRVAAVIVYSAPVSDVLRTVSTVRHEILVAGGIALLVALLAGYLVARALAQRVKRLELAAKQVAAGRFGPPIPVHSTDELGHWRSRSTRCSTSSSSSSWPARSSSPPPRTNCARRCSRSAGSSSCSRTTTSTPRPGGGSSIRCAIRSSGWASCRSTCSICRGWRPARSSCAPRRSTSAS